MKKRPSQVGISAEEHPDTTMDEDQVQDRLLIEPGENEEYYLLDGVPLVRVTAVLGQAAGHGLMMWHAKQAAMRAAAPLLTAGLFPGSMNDPRVHGADGGFLPWYEDLLHFHEQAGIRELSAEDAYFEVCNWPSNMREPERFRDEKGRQGKLAHAYLESFHLGTTPEDKYLVEWLMPIALKPGFIPDDVAERYAERGWDRERIALDHAMLVVHDCHNVKRFFDTYRPEWLGTGSETPVVNADCGYAGKTDAWLRFPRSPFEKELGWPFGTSQHADAVCDLKRTRREPYTAMEQMAAYMFSDSVYLRAANELHPTPEVRFAVCLWTRREDGMKMLVYEDKDALRDAFNRGFLPLVELWNYKQGKPKSSKTFKEPKGRKKERVNPFR